MDQPTIKGYNQPRRAKTHRVLAIAQLLSVLIMQLLPKSALAATKLINPDPPALLFPYAPTTVEVPELVLEGEASYYTRGGCLGCDPERRMANGELLNDTALTIAVGGQHQRFVGHNARVYNPATGQSVLARVTDTGDFNTPEYGFRIADVSLATKNAIGMTGGTAHLRIELMVAILR